MTTTPIDASSAEAGPATDRTGALPSEPAEPRTTEVAESHNQSPIAGGDVTADARDALEDRRFWLGLDVERLGNEQGGVEALRTLEGELEAAYNRALVGGMAPAVWERLLVEHRLVHALREYLEARA